MHTAPLPHTHTHTHTHTHANNTMQVEVAPGYKSGQRACDSCTAELGIM